MKILAPLLILAALIGGCRKNPDPESGFDEFFYFKFNFQNQEYLIQDSDIIPNYLYAPGPKAGWLNVFSDPTIKYDVELLFQFAKNPISKKDIKDLEGQTISTDPSSYPYIKVLLVSPNGDSIYHNDRDLDFGPSEFVIDEVIKGPRIEVYNEKKRSYILRGYFNSFNVILNSETDLYPVTDGEFSIRIHLED